MEQTSKAQYESPAVTKSESAPSGQSPVLYKVNPDKSVTPNTDGHTTSSHQLTTSGK